jgi:hypothetical protein
MNAVEFPEVNAPVLVKVIGDLFPVNGVVWTRFRWRFNGGTTVRGLAFALDGGRKVGADQCEWWHEVQA